jgi:hypothetical protein
MPALGLWNLVSDAFTKLKNALFAVSFRLSLDEKIVTKFGMHYSYFFLELCNFSKFMNSIICYHLQIFSPFYSMVSHFVLQIYVRGLKISSIKFLLYHNLTERTN